MPSRFVQPAEQQSTVYLLKIPPHEVNPEVFSKKVKFRLSGDTDLKHNSRKMQDYCNDHTCQSTNCRDQNRDPVDREIGSPE